MAARWYAELVGGAVEALRFAVACADGFGDGDVAAGFEFSFGERAVEGLVSVFECSEGSEGVLEGVEFLSPAYAFEGDFFASELRTDGFAAGDGRYA